MAGVLSQARDLDEDEDIVKSKTPIGLAVSMGDEPVSINGRWG